MQEEKLKRIERIKLLEKFYDALNCLACESPHTVKVLRGSVAVVLQPETVDLLLAITSHEVSIERHLLMNEKSTK